MGNYSYILAMDSDSYLLWWRNCFLGQWKTGECKLGFQALGLAVKKPHRNYAKF